MGRWVELVVTGNEDMIRAFVAGFVAGRGVADEHEVISERDAAQAPSSLGERLRELVSMRSRCVVLASDGLGRSLAEAIAQQGSSLGIEVVRTSAITVARCSVRAEIFSRDEAQAFKGLVGAPPAGVTAEKESETEDEHADAGGVELYAPMHAFRYRTTVHLKGDVGGVLALRGRLATVAGVDLGPVHLDGE